MLCGFSKFLKEQLFMNNYDSFFFYKKFILKHNNYILTHMFHLILFSYLLIHNFINFLLLIFVSFICLDVGGLLVLILTISLFSFNTQAHSIGSDGASRFLPKMEGTKSEWPCNVAMVYVCCLWNLIFILLASWSDP